MSEFRGQPTVLKYDFVLIARYPLFCDYLEENGINYWLVYPEKSFLNIYKERFINRGNSLEYVKKILNSYDEELEALKKYHGKRVILKDETLENYLISNGYTLIKK